MKTLYTVIQIDDSGRSELISDATSVRDAVQRTAALDPEVDVVSLESNWSAFNASESVRYEIGQKDGE